jgi:adenylate cyclase class IV
MVNENQIKNEYQYKFGIENKKDLIEKLYEKGIEMTGPTQHAYTYFRDYKDNQDKFIRIKQNLSLSKYSLDMKIRNKGSSVRDRYETNIDSPKQMEIILLGAGCQKIVTFEKDRHTYIGDYVRFDIDDLSYRTETDNGLKKLGIFLEVKFLEPNKQKVEELLRDVSVDVNNFDKRSIVEVYADSLKKID